MTNRAEILKRGFQNSLALPFAHVLSESALGQVLKEHEVAYRQTLYTRMVVLWAWLSQVLEADKSLSQSVKRILTFLSAQGAALPSTDTGAYSKARQRFSFAVLDTLLQQSASTLQQALQPEHLWCGRPVKAYDGTTVLMSDTPANQEVYPQHCHQKAGCGFPVAKLVVWFCVTTGAVISVAIAKGTTGEWQLARQLYQTLAPDDVVVADSAYGTYADLALVVAAKADGVFRKHGARRCDFRCGKTLGVGDHMVSWQRPKPWASTMSVEQLNALPPTLEVREVHLSVQKPGFRPKAIILVTTLLDAKRYPKAQLAELYYRRWQATEVNFKHLKTTLKMEMIAAKTPEMVKKDIWVHLLAYNLLRTLMWQAAQQTSISPLQISLQGTRQQLNPFLAILGLVSARQRRGLYCTLLELISLYIVPSRPNRVEPRVVKRRPKPFPRMQQPRSILKANLVA